MRKTIGAFSFTAIILGILLHAGAALAQAPRTWVSGSSGASDSNPCTRALPCATFVRAYAVTQRGGEIDVLDGGDFGPLVIGRAITIANDGAGVAGITPSADNAIVVTAGATEAVVLRGLSLNGVNTQYSGIVFAGGNSLLIDHCTIREFRSASGIKVAAPSAATLWVKDTVLENTGASNNGGIWISGEGGGFPGGGPVKARLERVHVLNAVGNGIRADGAQNPVSPIDVELREVTVDGASGGSGIVAVSAASGGPTVRLMSDEVTSSHNAGYGFRAVGGTASVYLSRSVSEDNSIGVGAAGGGQVFSYGDNRFAGNASGDGVTPTPIGQR